MTTRLELRAPDDWHVHFRDGAVLQAVVPFTAAQFRRAIVMPNLTPPVTDWEAAAAYAKRIAAAVPEGCDFTPLMTLYLTERTDAENVAEGWANGSVRAVKFYPAGATTNSESGVRDISKVTPVLERMAEIGMPLLIHGEVVDPDVDIFDREAVFIETVVDPLHRRLPELKIVLEHITTTQAVDYVSAATSGLAATITVHHLILNRNHLLAGGIRPHYYCLPVVKRETHRQALRRAATSGDARFFLGTDTAPHLDPAKLAPCGCAGIFSAPTALAALAHVFEEEGALARLETFASLSGPAFHGLAPNAERIVLERREVPADVSSPVETADGKLTVFDPGFPLHWAIAGAE